MPKGFWLIGVLVAIASAGPIVRWVIRRIVAPSARDAAEALRRYEAQILAPDFAALERNFGVEASPPLRALYADFALLRREDVLIGVPNPVARSPECHVGYFEPLTGEASEWEVDRTLLGIANNGVDNMYLVDPRIVDPPVLYVEQDVGRIAPIGVTLTQWLAAPRRDAWTR